VQGNSSGSITSTGSWGKVEATKLSGDGSDITGVTAEWDGTHTGTATFTGIVTASGVVSASGGFVGDGSNLTGISTDSFSDGTATLISGSSVSTGSFAKIHIADAEFLSMDHAAVRADDDIEFVGWTMTGSVAGMISGLQEDDLILYAFAGSTNVPSATQFDSEGYSSLGATNNYDYYYGHVWYKKMGATPDTSIPVPAGNTFYYGDFIATAWRNVHPVDLWDASVQKYGGSNNRPNTPSITTVTDKAVVVSIGMCSGRSFTAGPSGYTGFVSSSASGRAYPGNIGIAYKEIATGASEDPGEFTSEVGNHLGYTIALKKYPAGTYTTNYGFSDIWNQHHKGTYTLVSGSSDSSFSGGTATFNTFVGDGSGITGVTAEWDGTHTGTATFTGNVTASGVVSASGGFVGDGSNLTGISTDSFSDGTATLISGSSVSTGSFDKLVFDGNALSAGWTRDVPLSDIALVGTSVDSATVMSGLAENDILIYALAVNSGDIGASDSGLISAGWTHLLGASYSTYIYMRVYYKKVTSSVDTSFPRYTGGYGKQIIMAFRNVEPNTIFDVSSTTSAGNYATYPDPPSITTANDASIVIAVGGTRSVDITGGPLNYSNYTKQKAGSNAATAMAWKKITSAGAENPGAFTADAGNSAAASIALRRRPATTETTYYDLSTLGQAMSGGVSGSSVSTGSFGRLNIDGAILDDGNISGSSTSTGSFGKVLGDGSSLTSLPDPTTLTSVGDVTQLNNPNVASASRFSSNSAAYFNKTYNSNSALVVGKGGANQFGWPTSSAHYPNQATGFTKDNLSAGDLFTLRVDSVGGGSYITVDNVTYDLKILSVHSSLHNDSWGHWYSASFDTTYGDAAAVMALDGTVGGGNVSTNPSGYELKAEQTKLAIADRNFLTYNTSSAAWEPQANISGSSTSTGSFGTLRLDYDNLPTSNPTVKGAVWRDGTDLKISGG